MDVLGGVALGLPSVLPVGAVGALDGFLPDLLDRPDLRDPLVLVVPAPTEDSASYSQTNCSATNSGMSGASRGELLPTLALALVYRP